MRYVTPQRARQRLLPDAEICGAAVSWRCSSMPVVRCLSHLRQLLVREGNTDGTIAQALTFHWTNPRLLTTSRGWQDYHQLRNGAVALPSASQNRCSRSWMKSPDTPRARYGVKSYLAEFRNA